MSSHLFGCWALDLQECARFPCLFVVVVALSLLTCGSLASLAHTPSTPGRRTR